MVKKRNVGMLFFVPCIRFQAPNISHSLVSQAPKSVTDRPGQDETNMSLNFFEAECIKMLFSLVKYNTEELLFIFFFFLFACI